MTETILITGGTGMVGSSFRNILPGAIYISSSEVDLRDSHSAKKMLESHNPDSIIHLAAKVGGVKGNTDYIADFYSDNILINTNILNAAHSFGVRKVVSLLSTCIYPDNVNYPLTEDQIHNGEPHPSNFGYAYAKRMLEVQSRAYRQQYGHNFICAVPNNLYGENDNFDLENSHVIPALIRKIWEAKTKSKPSVEVWGSGKPLREFTYSKDIAEILFFLLENYNNPEPINIGNTEESSIREVVEILCDILEYDGKIEWNTTMPEGQFRKPSSNKRLLELGWKEKDYTPLKEGLKNMCDWFIMNYPNVRGYK
jgi:GDP-L-fucose synthase